MMAATTRRFDPTALANTLCVSLELGEGTWKLSFTSGFGEQVFRRSVPSRDRDAVRQQIQAMKERLGLARDCRVVSCYEAGREGFWLHRFFEAQGVENLVVDSSSIEVSRRRRRAKTDRLDGSPCWICCSATWPGAARRCGAWCGCQRWSRRIGGICIESCRAQSGIAPG
jgi:hypothetical protein